MAINYQSKINEIDKKIRDAERTTGPGNESGYTKIPKWHDGKRELMRIARDISEIERELASRSQEEKALAAKGRVVDGRLKQMDAEIKKMQAACKTAMKELAAQKAKAKTPEQKKQFDVFANKTVSRRDAVMRDGQRKEQIYKQEQAKRKVLLAEYKQTTSAITSLKKKVEKKAESFKKVLASLPK